MLPRLRFVIASLAIAILPMVLLGSGVVPTPPARASFENPRLRGTIALPAREITQAQYRYEQQALGFARRSNELSRLREMASLPLADWVAAPAGTEAPAAETTATTQASPETAPQSAPASDPVTSEPAASLPAASPPPPDEPAAKPPGTNKLPLNKASTNTAPADNPAPAVVAALSGGDLGPMPAAVAGSATGSATATPMTEITVVAPRKKAAKISRARLAANRAAAARRAAAAAASKAQQQLGPFQFFGWLFGPKPQQAATFPAIAPAAATKPATPTRTAAR